MRVTRFNSAPEYHPPLHTGVSCKRLQGHEAGPTAHFWLGHSIYAPGAAADTSPVAEETIYTVLSGEIVVVSDGTEQTLGPLDSVHFEKGAVRRVVNQSQDDASILVSIAVPQE